MAQGLIRALLARPWLALFAWAIVVIGVASGMRHLDAEFSATAYFAGDDPAVEQLANSHDLWGQDAARFAIVVQGRDWTTGAGLRRLDALCKAVEGIEGVAEVMALPRAPRLRSIAGRPMVVPVLAGVSIDAGPQTELLADPMLSPALVSADGRTAAVVARLTVDADDVGAIRPVLTRVAEQTESWAVGDERFWLAGLAAIRAELLDMIVANQSVLVPLSLILVIIGLFISFRRASGVLIPLVGAGLPVVLLLGAMGFFGEPLGILNQVYFTLIPVIAMADVVHLLHRYDEEASADPDASADTLVERSMGHVGAALLLTTATTVTGFGSMLASRMPALRHFGLWAAVGLVFALVVALGLLPLLLRWRRPITVRSETSRIESAIAATTDWAVAHRAAVVGVASVAVVALGLLAMRVPVAHTFTTDIPPSSSAAIGARLADSELGGVLALTVGLTADQATSERNEVREAAVELARQLRTIPEVRHVSGALLDDWRTGDDGAEHARLVVHTVDPGARRYTGLAQEVHARAEEVMLAEGVGVGVTGTALVAYQGIVEIASSLRRSLLGAFVVIFVMIALLFRDPRLAVATLLPNALPLAFGGALMWGLGWSLNPVSAVVFAIAIGIVVDDTVHLLSRYREHRERGDAPEVAVRLAATGTGRAVLLTTLILVAGFGANALATFPTNQTFGVLGTAVLVAALVADLIVLPAVLTLLDR